MQSGTSMAGAGVAALTGADPQALAMIVGSGTESPATPSVLQAMASTSAQTRGLAVQQLLDRRPESVQDAVQQTSLTSRGQVATRMRALLESPAVREELNQEAIRMLRGLRGDEQVHALEDAWRSQARVPADVSDAIAARQSTYLALMDKAAQTPAQTARAALQRAAKKGVGQKRAARAFADAGAAARAPHRYDSSDGHRASDDPHGVMAARRHKTRHPMGRYE